MTRRFPPPPRDDAPDAAPWRHPSLEGGPEPWAYGCGVAAEWPVWLRRARFAALTADERAWWLASFGGGPTAAWLRGETVLGYGAVAPAADGSPAMALFGVPTQRVDHRAPAVPHGVPR